MPVTRKYANSRHQRRHNQHLQRRQQQQQQQNPQPSNNQQAQTAVSMEPGTNKATNQRANNGPITRASSNRQTRSTSVKDNSKASQEQDVPTQEEIVERNLAALHKDMEDILDSDVYCAICREVYVNPVILNCSHSFCKFCLIFWLNKQVCCPTCRMVAVFQTENLALRNTISKMMSNTSAKYKKERSNLVQLRMEAEARAQQEGLVPLMEKKEAELEANLAHRVRNGRRRRRVIGQWKGPNGAIIWRTNIVGDSVIRYNPDETTESSAESTDDIENTDNEEINSSEADGYDEHPARGRAVDDVESDTVSDYRLSIFQIFDGDLPGHDSDSNDSEYVAPNMTASDEEDDDRMGDIDEETCEEDMISDDSSESSSSDSSDDLQTDETDTPDTNSSHDNDDDDSTDSPQTDSSDSSDDDDDIDDATSIDEGGNIQDRDFGRFIRSQIEDSMDWDPDYDALRRSLGNNRRPMSTSSESSLVIGNNDAATEDSDIEIENGDIVFGCDYTHDSDHDLGSSNEDVFLSNIGSDYTDSEDGF